MTAFQEQYPIPSSQVNTIHSDLLRRLGEEGSNDPEKCNSTNYWHGTHCNKKGTITTAQPKHGPCHGPGHFQPLWQPRWSPACGFFNTLIHCPAIWPPYAPLATQSTDLLCVHVTPHFTNDPCLVLKWLSSLFHGNFFLSISLQVMTHIKTSLQCQVLLLSIFLFLKPLAKP